MPESNPPKEMSMEIRLLIAFLLMGAVMFLTPYFFKSPPAPPKKAATPPATASTIAAPTPEAAGPKSGKSAPPAPTAPTTSEEAKPPVEIDNGVYHVVLTNQGATVRSWQLSKYKGNDNKPLELMNTSAGLEFPFSLYFPTEKPTANVNSAYYKQTADPDGLGVTYEFSDSHTSVRKVFRFQKNSYLTDVTAEVTIDGRPVPNLVQWRGGFGDLTVPNPSGANRALYFNVAENKLVEQYAKTAKDGPVASSGNFSFAGVADQYFAAVFLPQAGNSLTEVVFSDTVRTPLEQKPLAFAGTAVSNGTTNRFSLFVGPKDLDLLKRINPKLVEVVDFGFWSILAKPLFLIVNWVNDAFVHNFGWAIVLVTVVINFIMFPLRLTTMKSSRKMQALKPQIDAINAKYKDISMRDPRKANQQQETMELYKKNGVNPLGGCLPSLVQLALVYPFYKVFTVAVEMRGANWLWVTDLSQAEHLPIKILPIAMIVTQFVSQKMMPAPSADPNQQRMMMMMPLLFGFMFYQLPSGLVLYYLTGTVVGILQQWFFNRTDTARAVALAVQPPQKKKNGRK